MPYWESVEGLNLYSNATRLIRRCCYCAGWVWNYRSERVYGNDLREERKQVVVLEKLYYEESLANSERRHSQSPSRLLLC